MALASVRLRFNLRTLLVCITAATLLLAYSMSWIRQRRATLLTGLMWSELTLPNRGLEVRAPFVLRIFGEPGHRRLIIDSKLWNDPAQLARIRELFPEAEVMERGWK